MSEKETISDIVTEMRRFADRHRMHGEGQATKEFASRIEAAHKCEIERGAEAAQICGEIGEMVGMEKAAVVKQDFTTGNAAKMRKALEECLDELKDTYVEECDCEDCKDRKELLSRIKEALSAPPRKCDLYSNSKDAHEGYKRYEQDFLVRSNSIFDDPLSMETWLFAGAKGKTE